MLQIDYMIVADAAAEAGGKHYIHGAGWDTIGAATFPVVHASLPVASLLRIPWNEANVPYHIEVDLLDADGGSILPNPPGPMGGRVTVGRPPHSTPGNDLLLPLVWTMKGVVFPVAGDYVLIMRVDGEMLKRFPLHLTLLSRPAPPPRSPAPEG